MKESKAGQGKEEAAEEMDPAAGRREKIKPEE